MYVSFKQYDSENWVWINPYQVTMVGGNLAHTTSTVLLSGGQEIHLAEKVDAVVKELIKAIEDHDGL